MAVTADRFGWMLGYVDRAESLDLLGAVRSTALRDAGFASLRAFMAHPAVSAARGIMAAAARDGIIPAGQGVGAGLPAARASALPLSAVKLLTDGERAALGRTGVATISDLAALAREAEAGLARDLSADNGFFERPSAPADLIPQFNPTDATVVAFSSFVQERKVGQIIIELDGRANLSLPVTGRFAPPAARNSIEDLLAVIEQLPVTRRASVLRSVATAPSVTAMRQILDKNLIVAAPRPRTSLAAAFTDVRLPEILLGYALIHRQSWSNTGTSLGQVVQSVCLAPGESRNIARVSFRRSQSASRGEDTVVTERVESDFLQSRALEEVTSTVAREHQAGGTTSEASTSATALSAVASVAVGAGVGAAIGTVIAPGAGTLIGAAVGAGAGAATFGIVSSQAESLGTIQTDTSGERAIIGSLQQNIELRTSQVSSAVRSLYSTVVVEDRQAEDVKAETSNITNYNHMHALNLQFYEVLQRYRVTLQVQDAKPFMVLPYTYLDFTEFQFIRDYWEIVREYMTDEALKSQGDLYFVEDKQPTAPDLEPVPPEILPPQNTVRSLRVAVRYTFDADQTPRPDLLLELTAVFQGTRYPGSRVAPDIAVASPVQFAIFEFPEIRAFDALDFELAITRNSTAPFGFGLEVESAIIEGNSIRREVSTPVNLGTGAIRASARSGIVRKTYDMPDVSSAADRAYSRENARERAKILMKNAARQRAFDDLQTQFTRFLSRLERVVQQNRHKITRAILYGIETEELSTLLGALTIGDAGPDARTPRLPGTLPLRAFADSRPLGFVEGGILLRLYRLDDAAARALLARSGFPTQPTPRLTQLLDLLTYAARTADFFATQQATNPVASVSTILAPTGGLFCEAVLGRSNSAEHIDLERFFNWQDSPIPNAAPQIGTVSTDSRFQTPADLSVTNPGGNLTIIGPQALPDPTGLSASLAAIQKGDIFRDVSGAESLAKIISGLSTLAGQVAGSAATMTGESQKAALQAVAALAQAAGSAIPANLTENGGLLNQARDLDAAAAIPSPQAANPAPAPGPNPPPSGTPTPPSVPARRVAPPPRTRQRVVEQQAGIATPSTPADTDALLQVFFDTSRGTSIDDAFVLSIAKPGLRNLQDASTPDLGEFIDNEIRFVGGQAQLRISFLSNASPMTILLFGAAQVFGVRDIKLSESQAIAIPPGLNTYIIRIRATTETITVTAASQAEAKLALEGKVDARIAGEATVGVSGSPLSGLPEISSLPRIFQKVRAAGAAVLGNPFLGLVGLLAEALDVSVSGTVGGGASGSAGGNVSAGGSVSVSGTFRFEIPTGDFEIVFDRETSG